MFRSPSTVIALFALVGCHIPEENPPPIDLTGGTWTLSHTTTYDPDPSAVLKGGQIEVTAAAEAHRADGQRAEQSASTITLRLSEGSPLVFAPDDDGIIDINGTDATLDRTPDRLTLTVKDAHLLTTRFVADLVCMGVGEATLTPTYSVTADNTTHTADGSPQTLRCVDPATAGLDDLPLVVAFVNELDPLMELYQLADGQMTPLASSPVATPSTTSGVTVDDEGTVWARGINDNVLIRVALDLLSDDPVDLAPTVDRFDLGGFGGAGVLRIGDRMLLTDLNARELHAHDLDASGVVAQTPTAVPVGPYPRDIVALSNAHVAVAVEDGVVVVDPEITGVVAEAHDPSRWTYGLSTWGDCLFAATDAGIDTFHVEKTGGLSFVHTQHSALDVFQTRPTPDGRHLVAQSRGPDLLHAFALDPVTCEVGDETSTLPRTGYGTLGEIHPARGMGNVFVAADLDGAVQVVEVTDAGALLEPMGTVQVRPEAFNVVVVTGWDDPTSR